MSTTPTLNPQVLGEAENAHKAILYRILAGTGLTYHHYVTLTLTAAAGGEADRDQLIGKLVGALKIDNTAVLAVIADLTSRGLLEDLPREEPHISFTVAGQAQFSQIRAAVGEVTARLYADIPPDDLAAAGRVLTTITARAAAELADDGGPDQQS
jgi:DNA-binding MarR family transcriptional regulator